MATGKDEKCALLRMVLDKEENLYASKVFIVSFNDIKSRATSFFLPGGHARLAAYDGAAWKNPLENAAGRGVSCGRGNRTVASTHGCGADAGYP